MQGKTFNRRNCIFFFPYFTEKIGFGNSLQLPHTVLIFFRENRLWKFLPNCLLRRKKICFGHFLQIVFSGERRQALDISCKLFPQERVNRLLTFLANSLLRREKTGFGHFLQIVSSGDRKQALDISCKLSPQERENRFWIFLANCLLRREKTGFGHFFQIVSSGDRKQALDISCKLSPQETICMKRQSLFPLKNKKNTM